MVDRNLQRAQRAAGVAEDAVRRVTTPLRNFGFPYRAPTVPRGVEVPPEVSGLGAHYDTEWARRPLASSVRTVMVEGPVRLAARVLASPEILGTDRLADLAALEDPPALIFAPNHHSHLDTGLMIRVGPGDVAPQAGGRGGGRLLLRQEVEGGTVGAVAQRHPDRPRTDGSQVVRPDQGPRRRRLQPGDLSRGGRSPDGWGQDFKGGAAYLSARTGAPVVPVFIDGTGAIFGKGMKRPKPGRTRVVFGAPLRSEDGESTRRFSARIEAAVTLLGDEAITDFWTARQRAAAGTSPTLGGPDHTGWRRDWALAERRKLGTAGLRRRQQRRWPDLG
jgi:1-acyl-sn-glycerol-3-phosphate acyltransferase